jgi:plastocyanin
MISRLHICFSVVSNLALIAALPSAAATVAGATVAGKVELRDSREASVRKKMDYSGVVVWLEPADLKKEPVKPAAAKAHARMVQKDKTFSPHVLAIPVGATVEFPNFDPIFHNAFSNYDGKTFDLSLYAPGTSKSVVFSRPGIVRVFCNIHATMSAVIAVLETPYFDVSKPNGNFEIADVPPGDYRLQVFHERATAATLDALTRRVTVAAESIAVPPIAISESGYLAIPHSNKYGHDYPPAPDDNGIYPAVRK